MEPENRQMLDDVSPTLKAKFLKVLELKKLPLDQLAFVLIVLDISRFTSVGDLVSYYEKKNQTLSLEMWKFIFKKLQLSKEFEDLLAVHQREMMDEVNLKSSLPAETALPGTFCPSRDLNEQTHFSSQDKQFVLVNDSSSSSLVADARACEYQGAIPKRKQAQHPNSPVKPKKGQKVLRGLPVSVSYLNQSPIQGGDFGNDSKFSSCSPQSIKRVARNAAGYKILCNSSVQDESQDTVFLPEEGNSHTHRASSSMTLMHTLASGNEENQYKNSASTLIPEAGKAEHQIQLLASPLEDSNMQPDHLRTPARLTTTPEGARFKCSPSTPDPSLTYIEDNPRAGEYQGVIPKRNWYQPSRSTVKHDVRQELFTGLPGNESNLNLPSIQAGDFTVDCPQSSSPPPESSEFAARNSAGCEIFSGSLLQNENQDTGFFSDEGNSYPQMASLSTALMDTPASGHEGVQHQNSASSIALEGEKTEHQIQSMMSLSEDSKRQLDHFEITQARPNTPEGAQPGSNSPSLVTGRHNNRPNQTDPVEVDGVPENGEEIDRAVEHYDATENNGLLEETKQELESSQKSVLYLAKKLEERDSFCQTLLDDRFQLRQTLEESRQQYAHSQVERNNLQAANVELRRHLEDHKQLINTILEENRRLCLGSGAVVKLNHASDSSEVVEPAADEQPGMVPYLHELGELSIIEDSEDSTEEVFHDAGDGGLLVKEISESTCWFSFLLQTFNTSCIPACRQVLVMVKVCTVFSLFSNENLLWM